MKDFWNQRYAEQGYAYGEAPNDFFRAFVDGAEKPGRLLLPGEGEGRDAVYAARRGWRVEAFDLSDQGRKKALALAERAGVSMDYALHGYQDFVPEPGRFDAVALVFCHMPPALRRPTHRACVEALRPGGALVIEAFAKEQLRNDTGGPQKLEMLFSVDELAEDFAAMTCIRLEPLRRPVHEGPHHNGPAEVIQGVFVKPESVV